MEVGTDALIGCDPALALKVEGEVLVWKSQSYSLLSSCLDEDDVH